MTDISRGKKRIRLIGNLLAGFSITILFSTLVLALCVLLLFHILDPNYGPLPSWLDGRLDEEREFFYSQRKEMITSALVVSVMNFLIPIFLLRIGLCWRKGALFSMQVINSIKWIGVICLISTVLNLTTGWFGGLPEDGGLFQVLRQNTPELGPFFTGLVLLAISYILKYSRELESEVSLTV